jgi:dihydrofolate synthase/folylpolyglutamate synthase
MDYEEVLEYLRLVEQKGPNLELDNTRRIIEHFPFPLDNISFIQVAGTNGKGSTAYFLASILNAAGAKVGVFTSPHLHDVRERTTINNRWISKTDFSSCLWEIKELAEGLLRRGIITDTPTYFEYTFLVSLTYFCREKVDAAILEVGLGGRLDATSSITPGLSVITGISRDHTAALGDRVKDIAAEKAGIIKKGVPVVCGCRIQAISNTVIKERARALHAPFYNVIDAKNRLLVEDLDTIEPAGQTGYRCQYLTEAGNYTFDVHVNGKHQARNAAAAVKVTQLLNRMGFNIPAQAVQNGIKNTRIPARIEVVEKVILDGGHNVESIRGLSDFLEQKRKRRLTLIFGVLKDKDYKQMARLLFPFIENVILTEPMSSRALPAEKLVPLFNNHAPAKPNLLVQKDLKKALQAARKWQEEILVTGSFYLVGEMRHIIMYGG